MVTRLLRRYASRNDGFKNPTAPRLKLQTIGFLAQVAVEFIHTSLAIDASMPAHILDGKTAAQEFFKHDQAQINSLKQKPGLAVVLVGSDPASVIYVQRKHQAAKLLGIFSYSYELKENCSERAVLDLLKKLNEDPKIHGILVQLPLPAHLSSHRIIETIDPTKDVDGLHPYHLGRLAQGQPSIRPCTPFGIIRLLNYYQLPLSGKKAVVLGASNIVGRPLALELIMAEATVTICHRHTLDLEEPIRQADLIISATGIRNLIKTAWLNETQILIDVGIHRFESGQITGDLNFEEAREKVAWITPVPGGVGPMTIACLMSNTVSCARMNQDLVQV